MASKSQSQLVKLVEPNKPDIHVIHDGRHIGLSCYLDLIVINYSKEKYQEGNSLEIIRRRTKKTIDRMIDWDI